MMTVTTDLIGLTLLALGAAIIFVVRRGRFDRTNKYGGERFPTFGAKLRARVGSRILVGASVLLLVAGTITLASTHMDSWGWIVMAPVGGVHALHAAQFSLGPIQRPFVANGERSDCNRGHTSVAVWPFSVCPPPKSLPLFFRKYVLDKRNERGAQCASTGR